MSLQDVSGRLTKAGGRRREVRTCGGGGEHPGAAVRGAERPVRLKTAIEVQLVRSLRLHELQSHVAGDFRPC